MLSYGFALLSGVLLALSFPRFGHPALAWIALVPLLIALVGWHARGPVTPLTAFKLGLLAGVAYFVGTIYWTGTVLQGFGGLPTPLAYLAMLLLALYLALFPALTALVTAHLARRAGMRALLLMPAAWVSTEFLRGYLFGGFPWVPLGNSQVTVLPVVQLASVVGVYGLSALVALVNATLAYATVSRGRDRIVAVCVAFAVVASTGIWGTLRIADGALVRAGTPIRIGLIQGNIAQEDKWNAGEARRIFTTYLAMTRDAVRRGAEFVIWPESSTPFMFEEDPAGGEMLRSLAREVGVPILFGSDQVDRTGESIQLFNAAFLVTPDGSTAGVYRKMHLVPFGEYIPFKRWLFLCHRW